ncbi:ABC-F family ATP-binding cassette domain-containing protein [Oharaeibacter diazotrophicus]|uniref:ATP-binding cassette subfamily F protein 3 n=1 Tax=Oharaeibacter diazotrophicus TaxID=1920512 RepID=A0A4V3CVQ2_9HYPH|nr:ABC-F family ATP-binding cassette domain-containing protein [Oharaeibacter diazotrophicus]TDP83378.1 ATP-binding cassette subfamily F protein 3 [Oharaeibacter diazotrophicus]BBE72211.1 putative ABC transporter ATP-binding protein YheS [Pleomorphomonas sp. SM30]GLS78978.1 ABC transporter ATP-binding protein [Oharaeibacter diazotrophicus]
MLTISDLTYRIGGRVLIDKASVVVDDGMKVGLVGRNGTGKTTLFNLIDGDLSAESGSIELKKAARIGRVAQEAPGSEISLIDFVLAADTERTALMAEAETASDPHRIAEIQIRLADIEAHSAEARAATILSGLGFDAVDQRRPCADFSGGWRMRVALAAVLFMRPDLLLLDEPTNYLDLEGTLWLTTYVQRYPYTVILISHDRDLLDVAVDHVCHLDQGRLTLWKGGYTSFARQRREKLMLQEKMREKLEARRKHLQAFVDRFKAKASKARQAQSRVKMLEKMETIEAVVETEVQPIVFPDPKSRLAPPIITFDKVALGYDPARPVLSNLTLRIDDDDRIALLGKNGNGKSTFAKAIAGRLEPFGGGVTRATKLSIAYFAQHQLDELIPSESAFDHVKRLMPGEPDAKVRSRVAQMGLETSKMDTPARELSGGEKARLLLGLATFHGPNLLILDEPTNHLDIDSRESLIQALNAFEGAVILVSHDRHLVEATADRLWLVADGRVTPYDGDMDDYKRLVLSGPDERAGAAKADAKPTAVDRRRLAAERRAQLAPLRKKIQAVEARIEALKKDLAKLDATLADPALFAKDPARGAKLSKDRADCARAIDAAEEQWLELSGEYEAAEAEAG